MSKKRIAKGKDIKIPETIGIEARKTERSAVGVLMHWMREIIEKKNLDLGMPDVDTSGLDRKSPDIVIYESPRSHKVLLVMEAKPPYFDVFNEKELKEPAWKKANQRKAKYFAVTNFKTLLWYKTESANAQQPEDEQLVDKFHLSELENLDTLEESRYSSQIKNELIHFLKILFEVKSGKALEPKLAIDEFLVFLLYEKIKTLSRYYSQIIYDLCHKDSSFANKIIKWFSEQDWNFTWSQENFNQTARQTAYLLINKILFYNLLQAKRPQELDPMELPEGLSKGALIQAYLQGYFTQVLKIDYETVYTTDFIDSVAFPESKEVVEEIKKLVRLLKRYDFSKIGYDIIGRIFEKLIPPEERHNFGQYFTSPDVVDLILRFCLQHDDDHILDPSCGAGTFLVRAYQHKKMMNQIKSHEELLETLWGTDIAKFPAHLATINLAINDLSAAQNYPNIIQQDFFDFRVGNEGLDLENWRKTRAATLGYRDREVIYPRWFDAIVGNPPYTRHHQISELSRQEAVYKENLIENALHDISGKKMAEIEKRAGIHVYFFIHGTKLLLEGGYLGFIVANSWLDADYGKGLQTFFLDNYKIIAIIESQVERWFEAAEVNTCIVILQKNKDEKERNNHLTRFVYLKKPLNYFIPPAKDLWEKQLDRLHSIDRFIKTILAHDNLYENEDLRIRPKKQEELGEEGYNQQNEYMGVKWGNYTRAPEIFFAILEKARGKIVPLRNLAEVNEGKPTGANDFFYVKKDIANKYKIEKRFLRPGLMKPRGSNYFTLSSDKIERYFFTVEDAKSKLKGTGALSYIKHGERMEINTRNTFINKKEWYKFGARKPADLLLPCGIGESFYCIFNNAKAISSNSFTEIRLHDPETTEVLWAFFNSPVGWLFLELAGRTGMGGGMLKVDPTDIRKMFVLDPKYGGKTILPRLKNMLSRPVGTIEEEISNPDREILDQYVMADILRLSCPASVENGESCRKDSYTNKEAGRWKGSGDGLRRRRRYGC